MPNTKPETTLGNTKGFVHTQGDAQIEYAAYQTLASHEQGLRASMEADECP